ncbi:MAG: hypothetical protein ACRCWG_11835 [Sarcina sp.]
MDKKIEEKIIALYKNGSGINYISRLFKVKKAKITELVKDIEIVEAKYEEAKKEEIVEVTPIESEVIVVNEAMDDKESVIEINLPAEEDDYKTSIKVNKIVMEQFREFSKAHKEFTPKELISMAIVEYIEKHK